MNMREGNGSKLKETELKHHTRRLSIKEGIFWSGRVAFGDNYLAPFAIASGMSNSLVAILNSIWQLTPIGQILGSERLKHHNRKKLISRSLLIESLGWFMIFITSILYLKNFSEFIITATMILGLTAIVISNGAQYPAWFSMMGDVVDEKFRGRWWGKRTTINSFTTIVFSIISAFAINYLESKNLKIVGLSLFFLIAFSMRLISRGLIKKHYNPKSKIKKSKLSIKEFVKNLPKTNFGKFTIYRSLFGMAMGITASLVPIYLLRNLGLDYLPYILIMLSGTIFSVITLNLWGKLADTLGNYKIIAITSILMPFTPILWAISSNIYYLFIIPGFIGGTAWTAFLLVSTNFIYDNVKKEERAKAVSYYNLIAGISTFIGGVIGSILIKIVHTTWIEPIIFIFFIGAALRIILAIFWIPKIHESRKNSKSANKLRFETLLIKQIKPTVVEDLHEIEAIPQYLKEK